LAKTIQLRRYQIEPGRLEEFKTWVNLEVLPIRRQFGFEVEFMYVDDKNSEFIWAVSVQGSQDDFLELENRYDVSEERVIAGAKRPDCLMSVDVRFVQEN
jgi:ribosome biogenesis SPOUT family RNA methylase Rps3